MLRHIVSRMCSNLSEEHALSIFRVRHCYPVKYCYQYVKLHGVITHHIVERILYCSFDVGMSVHHHTIQISQPTRCNSFTSLLLDIYVWLNMFRAPPHPSSGAYNCISSFWFYRWSVVVAAMLVVVWSITGQTTTNNTATTTLQR